MRAAGEFRDFTQCQRELTQSYHHGFNTWSSEEPEDSALAAAVERIKLRAVT